MPPQIYLGQAPATAPERRALRALALELRARFEAARADEPTTLLLHFAPVPGAVPADLLLLQPQSAIVGAVRSYRGPIIAKPSGPWLLADTGAPITEAGGATPIQLVADQRDAVRARLNATAPELLGTLPEAQPFARMVGALICAPITHPDSQISLAIGEHRRQLKVLGLDELPAVAGMLRLGAQLAPEALGMLATSLFGARLWHNGTRFLFDLAPARFRLRVQPNGTRPEKLLALMEGDSIVGRRRTPQQHEYRLTLSGDELISADHAVLTVGDDERIHVHDTSKNGIWVTSPGAAEERIRRDRVIQPGDELRMGITRLRVERVEEVGSEPAEEQG